MAARVRDDERGNEFKVVGGIASILTCKMYLAISHYCGYFLSRKIWSDSR